MDPQVSLHELLAAVDAHDWERAEKLSTELLNWMQRRGFPPTTVGPLTLGKGWHRAVATFICHLATSEARRARKRRRRFKP